MSSANIATDELWTLAHAALCARNWAGARSALDALAQRHVRDYLGSYPGAPRHITDRVRAVNRAVNARV